MDKIKNLSRVIDSSNSTEDSVEQFLESLKPNWNWSVKLTKVSLIISLWDSKRLSTRDLAKLTDFMKSLGYKPLDAYDPHAGHWFSGETRYTYISSGITDSKLNKMDKFKKLVRISDSLQKVKDNYWGQVPDDIYNSNEEFAKRVETILRETLTDLGSEFDEDDIHNIWNWNPDFLDGGDEAYFGDFLDESEAKVIIPKVLALLDEYPQIGYEDHSGENFAPIHFFIKSEYFNPDEDE